MCSKKECMNVEKTIKNMRIRDIIFHLEKCEKCCFKKSVEKFKDKTYAEVRKAYVSNYNENALEIAKIYKFQKK